MADETLLLELDVGGDSGGAEEAIASVADSLGGMQSAIDAINDSNLEALGQAGQDAAAGGEAAGAGGEAAAAGAEQASSAAEGASGSFDALSGAAGALGTALSGIGFGELVSGAEGLGGALTGMAEEGTSALDATALGVGALGAVGVGVFAALGMQGGDWANEMLRLESITGLNQEGAERWATAMRIAGGDVSSLERASIRLSSALSDELAGKTTAATSALAKLGISATDGQGNLRSFGDVFPELLEKLSGMSNKTEQATLVGDIFGKRFAGTLLPLVQNYAEVMGNATDITGQFGIKGDDASQMAIDFNTKMTTLKLQLTEIAVSVLPSFIVALGFVSTAFTGIEDVMGPVIQFFKDNEAATVALAAVIGTALVASLIAATIAAWNLAVALMATGIPEVAAAVAILAVGLYELYVHWDDLIGIVKSVYEWFSNLGLVGKVLFGILAALAVAAVLIVAPFILTGIAIVAAIKYFGDLKNVGQTVLDFFSSLPSVFISVIDAIAGLPGAILEVIQSIPGILTDVFERGWGLVLDFLQSLPGLLWDLGLAALAGLMEGLSVAWGVIWDFITSIPGAIVDALTATPALLLAAGRTILTSLKDGFSAAWDDIWTFITGIPGKITDFLSTGLDFFQRGKDVITTFLDGFKAAWEDVKTWFKDHANDLAVWLVRILVPPLGIAYLLIHFREEIIDAFNEIISDVGGILEGLPGIILNILQTVLEAMESGWGNVWSFLTTLPGILWTAGLTALAGFMDGISTAWPVIWDFLISIPGAIFNALTSLPGFLWTAGNNAIGGLYEGLGSAFRTVWDFIVSIPDAIAKVLLGMAGALWWAGNDAFSGFAEGLSAAWDTVWNWIQDLPGKIVNFFLDVLGVGHSPSDLFHQMGVDVIQGLINGLLAHGGQLPGVLKAVFSNMPSLVEKLLEYAILHGLDTVAGALGDILGGIGGVIGKIIPFAFGGFVTQPTLALIGEAGPEAVIPLGRSVMPSGMAVGAGSSYGGGDTVINVTFNHEGPLMGDEVEARRFSAMIATMVRSEWERIHSR